MLQDVAISAYGTQYHFLSPVPASARTYSSHLRVIDGGRDSHGSPIVVAGEGSGIVHVAHSARLCGSVCCVLFPASTGSSWRSAATASPSYDCTGLLFWKTRLQKPLSASS